MLRIIVNRTPAGAKSYYATADYYAEEQPGTWRGKGAERLGLAGTIDKEDWEALCDNRDPGSGKTLTARQKEGRRVGYDFTFNAPKSLSLLYALTGDERLAEAFREAVVATMQELEGEVLTRVRRQGSNDVRTTGNLAWGEYLHSTARPVGGVPDPHLHIHAFAFNATWDAQEQRWKAADFSGLKRDAPYFEALFHSRLSRNLAELGLPIERTRHGWELAGVGEVARNKFSRRTAEIEQAAREQGITDGADKDQLGARTREAKATRYTPAQVRSMWRERLDDGERAELDRLAGRIGGDAIPEDDARPTEAVSLALSHVFERRSVVPERTLRAEALKRAYGSASHAKVAEALAAQPLLKGRRQGRLQVTTPEVLAEERAMLDFARQGRGACRPLAPGKHRLGREWLNADQRRAVEQILGSSDLVMLLRGQAGTGKTSMARETVEAIEQAGTRVFLFAPSIEASRGVLRAEGFANADTVQRLLVDPKLQEQVAGSVIWVDEAGQLGARDVAKLFAQSGKSAARLVLSGDVRQHGAVERGAPLSLLEREAGLRPAELREIVRQDGDYKRAVQALSRGRAADGLAQLDKMGWLREVPDGGERAGMLAEDYSEATRRGSVLVVSPTHAEGRQVTQAIRARLKAEGQIGKADREVLALRNLNLTEAERSDPVNFRSGDVLVFHQNARGYRKAERVKVGQGELPVDQARRFGVYRPEPLAVAPGDKLRITAGGSTIDGKHRLNNGTIYRLRGFDGAGNLQLTNGWTIARDFGHVAHGYVVTSHASQGKTVDTVLVAASTHSLRATSAEQAYVSASRGKKRAVIYTDDKQSLIDAVARTQERTTATDLLRRQARSTERPHERTVQREKEQVRG